MMSKEPLMTISDVAEKLNVPPEYIYQQIIQGNLETYSLGGSRRFGGLRRKVGAYRISTEQLEAFRLKKMPKSNRQQVPHYSEAKQIKASNKLDIALARGNRK